MFFRFGVQERNNANGSIRALPYGINPSAIGLDSRQHAYHMSPLPEAYIELVAIGVIHTVTAHVCQCS